MLRTSRQKQLHSKNSLKGVNGMKKKISCLAAVLILVLSLTGCGSYSFEQKELTEAIGVSKSVIDKLETQPDDNGDTGNELLELGLGHDRQVTGTNGFLEAVFMGDANGKACAVMELVLLFAHQGSPQMDLSSWIPM